MEQFKLIDDFENIKNSNFYDIIKNFDIEKMSSTEKEELKKFIIFSPKEEALSILIKFVDDYKYGNNSLHNKLIGEFISDRRFDSIREYYLKNYVDEE